MNLKQILKAQAVFWISATLLGNAMAQNNACGELQNGYGPFDFRTSKDFLKVVEQFHFGPSVENLSGGMTGSIGSDLDYTLRASPNHHRALVAMTKLSEKLKVSQPPGARYTVDCYYDRAVRFKPDDRVARMLYANHLAASGRERDAVAQLEYTESLAEDDPYTHYNLGLIFFDLKLYDRASDQAAKAIALGLEKPELKDKLNALGKWNPLPEKK